MITRASIEAHRKASELAVVQTLKLTGGTSILRSLSECRKIYGRAWMDAAVASGLIVGVPAGKRTLYSIESILAAQELQLREAEAQINTV